MIEIDDKIVSLELFKSHFCCDLKVCQGVCCVEGDSGAPLDKDECDTLSREWENYKPYMKIEGVEEIQKQGFHVLDSDGDYTTPLINNAECAYSIETESGTWCAIEKAWSEGKTDYRKPISCHLYPIREVKFNSGIIGIQYHRWSICKAAEVLGKRDNIAVYQALKDAIIRRYGEQFYKELQSAHDLLKSNQLL